MAANQLHLIEGQFKKHLVCGPPDENSYQELNPPAFKHWRFGEKNVYFLGAVQLSSLQSLNGCLQYMPVKKYPSLILHPHIPLLLKAAPANRQAEYAFFPFSASYHGEILFLNF